MQNERNDQETEQPDGPLPGEGSPDGSGAGPGSGTGLGTELGEEAQSLWREGEKLLARGDFSGAEAAYRRITEMAPGHAGAVNKLGVTLAEQEQLDEARQCFEKALELDPRHVPAWSNLGNILLARDETDEAIEMYQKALALDPDYATARNNLAAAYKKKGDISAFVQEYKRAQRLLIRQPMGDERGPGRPGGAGRGAGCLGSAAVFMLVMAGAAALFIGLF